MDKPVGKLVDEVVQRVQRRVGSLPLGLQAHIYRVRDIAHELARHHGIDPQRAELGMLAHDVARAMPDEELLRRAADLGLSVGLVERQVPLLLHGPVGAEMLRCEDGLADPEIYRAVYWHTVSHPSLGRLEKVIFLADKLDPQKSTRYPYLPELRQMAMEDLDLAMLEFLTRETISLAAQGQLLHPMMVETRNALLAALVSVGAETTGPY